MNVSSLEEKMKVVNALEKDKLSVYELPKR